MIARDVAVRACWAEAAAVDCDRGGDPATARAHRREARGLWRDVARLIAENPSTEAEALRCHAHDRQMRRSQIQRDGTPTPAPLALWHRTTAQLFTTTEETR